MIRGLACVRSAPDYRVPFAANIVRVEYSMEQEAFRQLPYDVEVEQALLGALLIDNYALERISNVLKPEHFYDPLHMRLYEAVERMWAKGHAVTPLTIFAALRAGAQLLIIASHLPQIL